jgi:hypothetical protein
MDKQNLIIFKFKSLYEIFKELEDNLNFEVFEVSDQKMLNEKLKNLQNYLIVSQKKIENTNNEFFLNQVPIKLSKLVEKLNIQFLKLQFNEKSELNIGEYILDLNSRELRKNNDLVLKLTEKETNIITYLSKSKNPVGINQLQSQVWSYHSKLETHTVETHIYRLRKKILETFNDDSFIISQKNGYEIN